ncbi:Retrovirus-related Pol polyprotein from transposon TNT 1-94, partial [Sesbania bispinosa]
MLQEPNVVASISESRPSFGGRSGTPFGRGRGRSNQRTTNNQPQKLCTFVESKGTLWTHVILNMAFPPNFKFKNRSQASTINSSISSNTLDNINHKGNETSE